MCECTSCQPHACCQGADERQRSCNFDSVAADSETMDFSSAEGCGIEVESCTQRCAPRVWRVSLDEDCSAKRPAECCG